jgi:hypothetical protein
MLHQKLCNGQIATANSRMQWRPSLIVLGIDVGPMRYQKSHNVRIAVNYCLNNLGESIDIDL